MKTNIVMQSADRILFGVTIRQDTKNSFLCLSDLQEAYTRARIEKGWSDRRIERILATDIAVERVYYILKEREIIKASFRAFIDEVKESSLVRVLKKYGVYKTVGARQSKRVICDPYIWVLLALELNPEIYAKVILWLTDNLIINRIEAGDRYNELCRACSKFPNVDYRSIGRGLNYIVFNIHETLLRNTATQEQLKELDDLQKKLAFAVDMGYIPTMSALMTEMRKIWHRKWDRVHAVK